MLLGYNNLSATGTEQPETLAMMKWIKSRHFVASASMHEVGFLVFSFVILPPSDNCQDCTVCCQLSAFVDTLCGAWDVLCVAMNLCSLNGDHQSHRVTWSSLAHCL